MRAARPASINIRDHSAHWESARSPDGGKTWQLHWVIDIRRRR
jgi:hypothetical protein